MMMTRCRVTHAAVDCAASDAAALYWICVHGLGRVKISSALFDDIECVMGLAQ
jgi:hypothetical protein